MHGLLASSGSVAALSSGVGSVTVALRSGVGSVTVLDGEPASDAAAFDDPKNLGTHSGSARSSSSSRQPQRRELSEINQAVSIVKAITAPTPCSALLQ